MSGWIEVEGINEVPVGTWLVEVDAKKTRNPFHVAVIRTNVSIVGQHFAFDMPNILRYCEIPK
tara:strand:- start:45 stop:233 length:189 start_codon:yes stop_codon:yes gene_type:complete